MAASLLILCDFSLFLIFFHATEFETRELKRALHTLMLRKHENCVSQKAALLLIMTKVLQFCRKQVGVRF